MQLGTGAGRIQRRSVVIRTAVERINISSTDFKLRLPAATRLPDASTSSTYARSRINRQGCLAEQGGERVRRAKRRGGARSERVRERGGEDGGGGGGASGAGRLRHYEYRGQRTLKRASEPLTVSCHEDQRATVVAARARPPPRWDCYSFRSVQSILSFF